MSQIPPPIPAPARAVIDVSVLREFTGQDVVRDPAGARHQYESARAAHASAKKHLKRANRVVQYRRIRLWAAKKGLPGWAVGLIPGSAAALVLAVVLILVADASLGLAFVGVASAYLMIGGGAFLFFRPLDGEDESNRVAVRTERLRQAENQCRVVLQSVKDRAAVAAKSHQLYQSIEQAMRSDANKRLAETNRLLSVEAGRLYPDEFERYVADIFQHLGFTIEVTGKSGDQGVDVLACRGSLRVAIQAKRYIGAVGNAAIQEVFAGMAHRRCHRCVVVTNSDFTSSAVALAQSTGCLLIGSNQLPALIRGEISF